MNTGLYKEIIDILLWGVIWWKQYLLNSKRNLKRLYGWIWRSWGMDAEGKKLLKQVRFLIRSARQIAARGVNTLQVMTNFEIGRLIIEHEQKGRKRAEYGKQIIQELSRELSFEFGRGFSKSNLEYMRRFFSWIWRTSSKDYPDTVWAITWMGW